MNKKSVLFSLLLGVFVIFYLGLVSAALGDSLSSIPVLSDLFNFFGSGSSGLSLILFTVLVILIIYSISGFIPVLNEKEGVQWAFSIIIGILCFFYVDMSTITTLLASYQSLGVIITAVIPFLVIVTFSIRIETEKGGNNYVFNQLLSNVVIWGFIIYLGYKLSSLYSAGTVDRTLGLFYWIALISMGVWAFTKEKLVNHFENKEAQAESKNVERNLSSAALTVNSLNDFKEIVADREKAHNTNISVKGKLG